MLAMLKKRPSSIITVDSSLIGQCPLLGAYEGNVPQRQLYQILQMLNDPENTSEYLGERAAWTTG